MAENHNHNFNWKITWFRLCFVINAAFFLQKAEGEVYGRKNFRYDRLTVDIQYSTARLELLSTRSNLHFIYCISFIGSNEVTVVDDSDAESPNARLITDLLKRHSRKVRPVRHTNETLEVHVLAALYQIVDVVSIEAVTKMVFKIVFQFW